MRMIQARESLRRVTEIAAGNGLVRKSERDRVLRAWRRDAEMAEPRDGPRTLAEVTDRLGVPVEVDTTPVELQPGWDGMDDAAYLAEIRRR